MLYVINTILRVQLILYLQLRPVDSDQKFLSIESRRRNATLADSDDIATIVMAAFEPMSDWQYFRQFRHAFPQGHRECVRFGVTQMLNDPDSNTEVIEAPHGSEIPLVAMASWTQKHASLVSSERDAPEGCYQSLNITRALDYLRKFDTAEKQYVLDVFGESQVYLRELATHPDYQLRGAGTLLVEAGIERGRREGVNVTLIAQPSAEGFYFKKGFKEIRNISVQSVDGDQIFPYNIMSYDFGNEFLAT